LDVFIRTPFPCEQKSRKKASVSHEGGIILEKGGAQVLANNYDDPSDNFMTPGISDFQQTSRRIELCAPRARVGEGDAKTSITGRVDDRPLFERFTYYINCQIVSVEALGEPVGMLLTALKNEDLRKERLK
jgi:hypothetical protein